MTAIGGAWARGLEIECGCFGGGGLATEGSNYVSYLARDLGFLLVAAYLALGPRSRWAVDNLGPAPGQRLLHPGGERGRLRPGPRRHRDEPADPRLLYRNQPDSTGTGLDDDELADLAEDSEVSRSALGSCIGDGTFADWVAAATEAASTAGFAAVPAVLVDGSPVTFTEDEAPVETLGRAVDAAG